MSLPAGRRSEGIGHGQASEEAACEGGKITSFSKGQKVKLQNGETLIIEGVSDIVTVLEQNSPHITIENIQNQGNLKCQKIGKE